MKYSDAKIMHETQWIGNKSDYAFPYDHRYNDDYFVTVTVPIIDCETQQTVPSKVNDYIKLLHAGVDLGPSWVTFGKRLKDGSVSPFWHNRLYVVDGNHRLVAKKIINNSKIDVVIPNSDYNQYMREKL